MTVELCKKNPLILKEVYMTSLIGVAAPKNHFLFDALESTIQLLIPAGVPQYMWTFHYNTFFSSYRYKEKKKKQPKVLSFDNLSFGFVVWLNVCGAATFCFFVELLYFYLIKDFFGFNVFFSVLNLKIRSFVHV